VHVHNYTSNPSKAPNYHPADHAPDHRTAATDYMPRSPGSGAPERSPSEPDVPLKRGPALDLEQRPQSISRGRCYPEKPHQNSLQGI
jgi:hypothetical protein